MNHWEVHIEVTSIDSDFRTWRCYSEGFQDGFGGNEEEALGDFIWKNRKEMPFKIKKDKVNYG